MRSSEISKWQNPMVIINPLKQNFWVSSESEVDVPIWGSTKMMSHNRNVLCNIYTECNGLATDWW